MGSDLYNNLIRYFIEHLRGLREVRMKPMLLGPVFVSHGFIAL